MFFQNQVATNSYYYDEFDNDEFGGIGSFFKKIAKVASPFISFIPGVGALAATAIQTGLGAADGIGGGGGGGVAKGLAGITAFGNQIMQGLDQIAANPVPENVSQAEKLAAALSDSAQVYQAKKGKDAAALADFKQKAAAKLAEIKQAAVQLQQQQSGSLFGGGGDENSLIGGVNNNTLLLFGGGGAALILILVLLRK